MIDFALQLGFNVVKNRLSRIFENLLVRSQLHLLLLSRNLIYIGRFFTASHKMFRSVTRIYNCPRRKEIAYFTPFSYARPQQFHQAKRGGSGLFQSRYGTHSHKSPYLWRHITFLYRLHIANTEKINMATIQIPFCSYMVSGIFGPKMMCPRSTSFQ